jgi:hypothetical protein
MFGDTWFCQKCGDIAFLNSQKPSPTRKQPEARTFPEWRETEQQSGKERESEPVQIAPLPPYTNYPIHVPLTEREARKPEREKVPVSYSPTPARTKPFLPARRGPEVVYEPVSTIHDVQIQHVPPHSEKPVQNQPESFTPVHQKEVTPVKESELEKFNGNLSNQPQDDNFSLIFPLPRFRSKLTKKVTFRGRRGRQRTAAEVIELLTYVQTKGVWPREISDQMQRYYKREYPEYFRKSRKRKVHA